MRSISLTFVIQGFLQLITVLSGLLIVHGLSQDEYAHYTLAYSIIGMLSVMCDSGIINSLYVVLANTKEELDKFKITVYRAVTKLHIKLFSASLLIGFPVVFYALNRQGGGNSDSIKLLIIIFSLGYVNFHLQINETILKYIKRGGYVQFNQLFYSLVKLLLIYLTTVYAPTLTLLILATLLCAMANTYSLYRTNFNITTSIQYLDHSLENTINDYVKKNLPISIYYALSGQITIWCLSYWGDSNAIANLGASGRIAALFQIFAAVVSMNVIPYFVRSDAKDPKTFWRFISFIFLITLVTSMLTYLFYSNPVLGDKILGKKYAGLEREIALNMITAGVLLISNSAYTVMSIKKFSLRPAQSIPILMLSHLLLLVIFKPSDAYTALLANLLWCGFWLLVNMVAPLVKWKRSLA